MLDTLQTNVPSIAEVALIIRNSWPDCTTGVKAWPSARVQVTSAALEFEEHVGTRLVPAAIMTSVGTDIVGYGITVTICYTSDLC